MKVIVVGCLGVGLTLGRTGGFGFRFGGNRGSRSGSGRGVVGEQARELVGVAVDGVIRPVRAAPGIPGDEGPGPRRDRTP